MTTKWLEVRGPLVSFPSVVNGRLVEEIERVANGEGVAGHAVPRRVVIQDHVAAHRAHERDPGSRVVVEVVLCHKCAGQRGQAGRSADHDPPAAVAEGLILQDCVVV